ncbi:MAG TPA: hypothetical protein VFI42_17600 [Thermomicrobiaceae bacterium]|nr:hypothetical protein [Thermomicrobiaceae bacterium]
MPDPADASWEIDGRRIEVSGLDKRYWPETGITKGDVLAYYRTVAPAMLPYLQGRPLTLVAFGAKGQGRYLRARPSKAPAWLPSVEYRLETKDVVRQEPVVDNAAGLLWYVNYQVIEFHLWLSRPPALDRPDWAVFDLDPGAETSFEPVLETALRVRAALAAAGLRAWPKTSGGRGLHLFLPLLPEQPFEAVRAWVREVGEQLARAEPTLIAAAGGATHQGRLVTVDFAQNSIARSMAAPYTLRATPQARVSTPLTWAEVEAGRVRPEDFTIQTIPARLAEHGEPWSGITDHPQRLPIDQTSP